MYKFIKSPRKMLQVALFIGLSLTAISWRGTLVHSAGINFDLYAADTIPDKPQSLDDQIKQLEKAQQELQQEISSKDWGKMEAEMANSLARINTKEIEAQVEKAMKEAERSIREVQKIQLSRQLDLEKMQDELSATKIEIEKEFAKKDWEKEMKQAMEEVKKASMEISKVNEKELREQMAKMKLDLQKNKEVMAKEIARAKEEIRTNGPMIKASLNKAHQELLSTRKEFIGYKTMVGAMQNEGLITDPKNYDIEFSGGELIINGKKQPASVTDRYRSYFRHDNIRLKNEEDNFKVED
ncbi:coiled-coil domain-containing protein [Flavihumibacter profundi]|uniref:hypothetical protein n=1 Tax=Flavihumibacter profundi TaxID=2716883 RepID=UPI001CC54F33|nr:hypothetical protein [Flavihumibacter profundi]MBZ5858294.1 hypothetical protein [Flavihumibacter profundi]